MPDVYVVRNQLGHYWGKRKDWVDGRDAKVVMRTKHEDEAINTLFELGSKDFALRGEVVAVALNERDEPIIEPSEHLIEEVVVQDEGIESDGATAHAASELQGEARESDEETHVASS